MSAPAAPAAAETIFDRIRRVRLVPEARSALAGSAVPFVEGGLTPTEVLGAARHGLAKLFPAHVGGISYLKSLLAVQPTARIMPTGGIPLASAAERLATGAFAVGIGSDLTAPGDVAARVATGAGSMIRAQKNEVRYLDAATAGIGHAGDTYNTAVYLQRTADALGTDVEAGYLTGLGADENSAAMCAAWTAEGVVDRSVLLEGLLPGLYTVRVDDRGERRFSYWRSAAAARHLFATTEWVEHLDAHAIHLPGITQHGSR